MVKKRLIKPFRVFDKFDSYLYSDFEYVLETPSSSTKADSPSKVSLVKLSWFFLPSSIELWNFIKFIGQINHSQFCEFFYEDFTYPLETSGSSTIADSPLTGSKSDQCISESITSQIIMIVLTIFSGIIKYWSNKSLLKLEIFLSIFSIPSWDTRLIP